MRLKIGKKAPEFRLLDQNGKMHSLADYKGKWLLLYFYPKDDTPGCTKEACSARDNFEEFKSKKAEILGVSTDTVKSHQSFAQKFSLTFPILADEKKEVVKAYGVWAKKSFMGREYMGTLRNSFLINPDGKIEKVYSEVKPEEHILEVLEDLKKLVK